MAYIFIPAEAGGCAEKLFGADFSADLTAGLIVGIVALPLSMALAIASGLKPEIGNFHGHHRRAFGFGAGRFARANRRTGGRVRAAAGADCCWLHGPEALVVCAFMAGVILFVLGACKLGTMIRYIPFPVVTGFTSGIAIIIMSTQIRDFFGLQMKLPPDFMGKKILRGRDVAANHFQFFTELADGSAGDPCDAGDLVLAEKNGAACCRVRWRW